ncbi:MAG: hypothetical protein IKN48_01715 [Bacteroidaceae bacterium]|nr:hypothetical protein [Bacteroidaceae bacterium]
MEERFIDAVVIKSGEKVRVRQTEAGSEYFVTEDNSPYHSKELDFTQQDIVDKLTQDLQDQMGDPFKESRKFYEKLMSSLEPLESEKRRTEAATREYWRKLRGDIYLELVKAKAFSHSDVINPGSQDEILETTNKAVSTLYLADKNLFFDVGCDTDPEIKTL